MRKILKKLWMKKLETTKRRPSPDQGSQESNYQMIQSLLSVQNVEQFIHIDNICWHITDLNMRGSNILVISVIIKLHNSVIFGLT